MNNSCTKKLAVLVSVILAAAATTYSIQKTEAILGADVWRSGRAPIATSGSQGVIAKDTDCNEIRSIINY